MKRKRHPLSYEERKRRLVNRVLRCIDRDELPKAIAIISNYLVKHHDVFEKPPF